MPRPKILVAEDSPSDAELICFVLDSMGFQVTCVTRAESAMQAVASNGFAAALIDLSLPDMDGIALIREMKRNHSGLPVAVVSGHDELTKRRAAFEAGAFMFLPKPIRESDAFTLFGMLRERQQASERPRSWRTTLAGYGLGTGISLIGLAEVAPQEYHWIKFIGLIAAAICSVLLGNYGVDPKVIEALLRRKH